MSNSLEVSNLNKKYKDFNLDNISFSLKSGSIMGFIGENGSGKTTTIKSLLNVIRKDSGTVRIFGRDMEDPSHELFLKEQVGVVFDECHFQETLNAMGIQSFMSKIYKNWNSSVYSHYLKKFNLPSGKIVKEYSRGMKMKLSIAVSLSHEPKLLILDEATGGLDPVVRNEILDVFFDFIQDETHSIFMSSHITSDLEKICDYITYIRDGKLVISDSKDEIIYNYGILKCTREQFDKLEKADILGVHQSSFGYEILVGSRQAMSRKYPECVLDHASLEDIMVFYSGNAF